MASSSSPVSVFDEHRFHKAHNQQLFESYARRRKVIPEVGFNLNVDEYPQIMEQIALREVAGRDELPYKSFVRGKEVDFSPSNIRRVMRFKRETTGAETDYNTRKAIDQRLNEVLRDLCILGATWKMSSSQPADAGVPLREFTRTPRIPKFSYITAKRMETIRFPRNQPQQQQEDEEEDKPMPQADGGNFEEEDQQPPQKDQQPPQHGFPNFQPRYESQYHEEKKPSLKSQADYMEEVKQLKEKQEHIYNHNQRFHLQIWQEQEKLAKEIQEVRRSQLAQAVANNKRLEMERNMQLALERQGRDIVEIRKQVNLWTNNVSSKEAYACWAQQQANPNLSEISITQITDIMQTNLEKGRPLFHGFLKSDYGASSSSQVDPEEPVLLRTAPPSPYFRPPHPPPN
ncbi:hypothetical protein PIB30_094867 [Stylosanthes scabra]|uniref:Uncharacterized protein n=1 Tax=Stylosanthes scabra TaxID=79078 RepID=A0ABU6UV21_9FABA|nr:hypothetical protein [Stylosanthes scabra]